MFVRSSSNNSIKPPRRNHSALKEKEATSQRRTPTRLTEEYVYSDNGNTVEMNQFYQNNSTNKTMSQDFMEAPLETPKFKDKKRQEEFDNDCLFCLCWR